MIEFIYFALLKEGKYNQVCKCAVERTILRMKKTKVMFSGICSLYDENDNVYDYQLGLYYIYFEYRYIHYLLYLIKRSIAYDQDYYTNDFMRVQRKYIKINRYKFLRKFIPIRSIFNWVIHEFKNFRGKGNEVFSI